MNNNEKNLTLVDWRLYDVSNPALLFKPKANEKSVSTLVYCTNIEKCEIIKKNSCLGMKKCPYSKIVRSIGYTKRARKNSEWIKNKKEIVKNITQKEQPKKLVEIDDYIYFDYPHWNFDTKNPLLKEYNSGIFSNGKNFIKKEHFNIEFLKAVLERNPQAMFGGSITSYQKEVVPKIKKHLMEELPKLYQELITMYPELKLEKVSNIKRTALLSTIPNNTTFKYEKFECIIDGEYLIIKEYNSSSLYLREIKLKRRNLDIKTKIEKDDTIVIQNDNQWDNNTIFID